MRLRLLLIFFIAMSMTISLWSKKIKITGEWKLYFVNVYSQIVYYADIYFHDGSVYMKFQGKKKENNPAGQYFHFETEKTIRQYLLFNINHNEFFIIIIPNSPNILRGIALIGIEEEILGIKKKKCMTIKFYLKRPGKT